MTLRSWITQKLRRYSVVINSFNQLRKRTMSARVKCPCFNLPKKKELFLLNTVCLKWLMLPVSGIIRAQHSCIWTVLRSVSKNGPDRCKRKLYETKQKANCFKGEIISLEVIQLPTLTLFQSTFYISTWPQTQHLTLSESLTVQQNCLQNNI